MPLLPPCPQETIPRRILNIWTSSWEQLKQVENPKKWYTFILTCNLSLKILKCIFICLLGPGHFLNYVFVGLSSTFSASMMHPLLFPLVSLNFLEVGVLHYVACRILVPQPRIEPGPLALEAWSLKYWTTREVPPLVSLKWIEDNLREAMRVNNFF